MPNKTKSYGVPAVHYFNKNIRFKYIFLLSAFVTIVTFQNCGEGSFQAKLPSIDQASEALPSTDVSGDVTSTLNESLVEGTRKAWTAGAGMESISLKN